MRNIFVVLMVSILAFTSIASALTPKEQKGVKILKSPNLTRTAPDWVTPFPLDEAPEDIDYWKNIIPYEQDRDADVYIVMPTIGVVAPIIFVPEGTKDYNIMTSGKQIDINKYLDRGALHYAKSGMPGDEGNPVIFAHSNFFADGVGDYKTIFADIMDLDVAPEDEMWIYVRENGEYDLRKFEITKSYETVPTDVGVMKPLGGKELTVFACTDGLAGRWILRGKFIERDETLVTYPLKWEMLDILENMSNLDAQTRQSHIATILAAIETQREDIGNAGLDYHDKYKKYLLNYFEKKLLEVY